MSDDDRPRARHRRDPEPEPGMSAARLDACALIAAQARNDTLAIASIVFLGDPVELALELSDMLAAAVRLGKLP
jgi:hypothetical protein